MRWYLTDAGGEFIELDANDITKPEPLMEADCLLDVLQTILWIHAKLPNSARRLRSGLAAQPKSL